MDFAVASQQPIEILTGAMLSMYAYFIEIWLYQTKLISFE